MSYFVTGATGFIGRQLVSELLKREGTIYVLVRAGSRGKLERAMQGWGTEAAGRVVAVAGDLSEPTLGVTPERRIELRGRIAHLFHLGAVYDLSADAAELERANVAGTRNAIEFAQSVGAGCFHLVSSIASAGRYPGVFTEDMFEEAQGLDHPYFRTKHDSEALVRSSCGVPWRVYRPGMVVGHSRTGQIDKIDGPYYFFKPVQKLRRNLPQWFPLIGFEGGHVNVVPVDFVAAALAHLAHVPGQDGRCFHLTDPRDRRIGEVLNLFLKAAHAPEMALRLDPALLEAIPDIGRAAVGALRPLERVVDEMLRDSGVPRSVAELLNYPTIFDSSRAQALLADAGIAVPPLEDYAWRLWDYWERRLDPDLFIDRSLRGAVENKVVLITGGSSGIGLATALKVAEAGAHVIIVARDPEKLAQAHAQIAKRGRVTSYGCDISDLEACDALARRILAEHGHVDVLVNNAGRSIRRAIENSYERFHDYERLMRINYYAAVRLTLGLLPAMTARGDGHVINISSIGVLSNAPRFSAYVASKAALEAFSRCAAAEYGDRGVRFTVINMPLVRTPMVAPTRIYEQMPLISPEEAADLVSEAMIHQPKRVATRLGIFAQLMNLFAPKVTEIIMTEAFKMFPESEAASGERAKLPRPAAAARPSQEMIAFASIMRGIHW
jgi:NAD(P)-dependent dehydrogenase (short-subunit alcohol dehydrogenase family)